MMRRSAGFDADKARRQLLKEWYNVPALELTANDYITCRVNSVDLKNRLRDIETECRDRLHVWLLRIVGASTAPTSMALPCRWRSRPQHQKRTNAPQQNFLFDHRAERSGAHRTKNRRLCGARARPPAEVAGPKSPVDFPEHNIERAEDRRDVGQHVPTAQEIHRLEVRERRCANLAFVRPVGAVGHQIDPELTLGRLDGGIYFASRNPVAFSVKLEVMNERLHRALHLGAARGHDLGINKVRRALPIRCAQLGNALLHDTHRLAHLFHADAVAVVTIAVLADRDVEIELRIALVRLRLA